MKKLGSNINTIKSDNYSAILNCIRKKAVSRAEISNLTGLTKSAVTTITKQLIQDGQIAEIGTENTAYGRHPILLEIVKDHKFAMGMSLHRKEIIVCVTNLKCESLETVTREIQNFNSPEDAINWAYYTGIDILKKHKIPLEQCIGIGISAPGPLDYKNGIILTPPNFPLFHNFKIKEHLSEITQLPIFLNNAPVLMALYENQKRMPEIKNYAFVVVDFGVGSAIVQNGKIYRGSSGFSGEIGHTTIDINGKDCSCGNKGCLECYITQKAIKDQFNIDSYYDLVNDAYSGKKYAEKAIESIAEKFSAGIINIANLLDLEAIVIWGELNYRSELLISKIQSIVDSRSIISKAHPVKILPSIIENSDGIGFSTSAIIDKYFSQSL